MNRESNNLKQTNRSQSLSALANNSQPLKRSNLSNSTMSLNSPNKDVKVNSKIDSESEEEEDEEESITKSTEETSESEEESMDTSQTKQSSENQSSYIDDDEAVQIRPISAISRKKAENEKRNAPVPQVRFSKLVNHMKK